jgi:coatomer subunit beta'
MCVEFNGGFIYQEKRSVRPTFSAERIYGGALLAMCSNDFICFYDWAECRLIRRIDVSVKVSNKITFKISFSCLFFFQLHCFLCFTLFILMYQNLHWADSGDLVAIASDTSFYILKYSVRIYSILVFHLVNSL